MKRGLVKPFARDHLTELGCFPAVLDRIVGGVHQKGVTMPVGIHLAADRPGGAMDKTSPERVAGGPILVSAVDPHLSPCTIVQGTRKLRNSCDLS